MWFRLEIDTRSLSVEEETAFMNALENVPNPYSYDKHGYALEYDVDGVQVVEIPEEVEDWIFGKVIVEGAGSDEVISEIYSVVAEWDLPFTDNDPFKIRRDKLIIELMKRFSEAHKVDS